MPGTVKDLQGCAASGCLVAGLGPIGLLAALYLRLRNAEVSGLDANMARPRWLNLFGGRYVDGRQVTPDHPLDQIGTFDVIVEATGIAAPEFDLLDAYVPPDDAHSNYRMAKEALLEHVPCPAPNVHPMPTHFSDPDAAARDYEATLRRYFSGTLTGFDVVLLGSGPEGHTASLFPGSPALPEATRWVHAVAVPADLGPMSAASMARYRL